MQIQTKQDRAVVYQKAIDVINTYGTCGAGLCYILTCVIYDHPLGSSFINETAIYYYMDVNLPELYAQKPEVNNMHGYGYWFALDDAQSRINALKEAIKLCEK